MQAIEYGLSLWNPWAWMIAAGVKKIETRPWDTKFRGWLAIASTLRRPRWTHQMDNISPEFADLLKTHFNGVKWPDRFVEGHVLAIGRLVGTFRVGLTAGRFSYHRGVWTPDPNGSAVFETPPLLPEVMFGDYSVGRYGWRFDEVIPLREPLRIKGGQRLWRIDAERSARIIDRLSRPMGE